MASRFDAFRNLRQRELETRIKGQPNLVHCLAAEAGLTEISQRLTILGQKSASALGAQAIVFLLISTFFFEKNREKSKEGIQLFDCDYYRLCDFGDSYSIFLVSIIILGIISLIISTLCLIFTLNLQWSHMAFPKSEPSCVVCPVKIEEDIKRLEKALDQRTILYKSFFYFSSFAYILLIAGSALLFLSSLGI